MFRTDALFMRFSKKLDKEKGSFTIEASLIFPVIFILTVLLIFISIYIYEKVTLYYAASQAAERAAYYWNNSHQDPVTGEFSLNEYDGLYWRMNDDRIIEGLLNIVSNKPSLTIQLNDLSGSNDELARKKLIRTAGTIAKEIQGTITYQNHLLERKIIVELESPLKIPAFVGNLIGHIIKAKAEATVTDPVEFIRTVDLLRYYEQIFSQHKEKAKEILKLQKKKEESK